MVKQGHYAKVSRQKKQRQLKQRHQVHEQRALTPDAVVEFLQVRYHLTRAKQQRPVVRKTMQRFVALWLTVAQKTSPNWSVMTVTKQTLQQFNRQLPWQGYAIISQSVMDFQAFLVKEVPAVPLEQRLTLGDTMTEADWKKLVTTQLAVNALLGLVNDLSQITNAQIAQLQAGLMHDDETVDWSRAANLVAPVTVMAPDADAATKTWYEQLEKLSLEYFD